MSNAKVTKAEALIAALQTKLADAIAKRDEFVASAAAEEAATNIEVGAEVAFTFGRGETKTPMTGKVIAVVPTEHGKLLKVLAGEGKALKVYDVTSKQASVVPVAGALTSADVPVALPGEETVDVSLVNAQATAAQMGINLDDALNQTPVGTADDAVAGL